MDRALSKEGNGGRHILLKAKGKKFEYALRFNFPSSNNMTKYEALKFGLKLVKEVGANGSSES